MRAVRWASAAEVELIEASSWYESRQQGLGADLILEVGTQVERARGTPQQFPVWEHDRRFHKALVERFPYVVFFRFTDEEVFVFALAHTKRRPAYWLSRTGRK